MASKAAASGWPMSVHAEPYPSSSRERAGRDHFLLLDVLISVGLSISISACLALRSTLLCN